MTQDLNASFVLFNHLVDRKHVSQSAESVHALMTHIGYGMTETKRPILKTDYDVLVRTDAFSCNYRDRSIVMAGIMRTSRAGFFCFGSDFLATVEEIGAKVQSVSPGDRIIPDCAYVDSFTLGFQGVPTNSASRRWHVFNERQVITVPKQMTDIEAAAFSVGAQTSYSMIRKSNVRPGKRLLITAGRSCTSMFVISALATVFGGEIHVLTSTAGAYRRPKDSDVRVHLLPLGKRGIDDSTQLVKKLGYFDIVIDPFFDVYMPIVMPALRGEGTYITCGLADQLWSQLSRGQGPSVDPAVHKCLSLALVNNVSIIGNCLGSSSDLGHALADYDRGVLKVPVDRVFGRHEMAAFITQSFSSGRGAGKSVFSYNATPQDPTAQSTWQKGTVAEDVHVLS